MGGAAQRLVEFSGDGAGVEELSWGQLELWRVMDASKTWLPIGSIQQLPAGFTVDDAVADLRFVMSRYPSMRTRLRFDPDGPKQVVSEAGEIALEIVDAADADDPAEIADQVWREYRKKDYDFTSDWPVRMGVVRHRGTVTHRVWVMCHLVTDGSGSLAILADMAERDGLEDTHMPPLEQARWQQSPAGQRQCAAAMRHWEKVLRSVSAPRFPEPSERPSPRYRRARFNSPATQLALRTISARTGVEVSSVLLGVYAVSLARVTGINPVVIVLVVNNRFRRGLARTVSPLIQPGLCIVDVPDATVDEAVRHARGRAISAYKYAYHDPNQREALIEQVNQERGETVDLECSLNDVRIGRRDESGAPPTPEQIRAALPRTSFEWTQQQDHQPLDKLYVTVENVVETFSAEIASDAHHVSPVDLEAFVRGMEEVAVAAAFDPATRTCVVEQHAVERH